ncbi:MAG: Ferredoxin, 2Fe-2S, partial [uncultured Pseudonocardia sp.]
AALRRHLPVGTRPLPRQAGRGHPHGGAEGAGQPEGQGLPARHLAGPLAAPRAGAGHVRVAAVGQPDRPGGREALVLLGPDRHRPGRHAGDGGGRVGRLVGRQPRPAARRAGPRHHQHRRGVALHRRPGVALPRRRGPVAVAGRARPELAGGRAGRAPRLPPGARPQPRRPRRRPRAQRLDTDRVARRAARRGAGAPPRRGGGGAGGAPRHAGDGAVEHLPAPGRTAVGGPRGGRDHRLPVARQPVPPVRRRAGAGPGDRVGAVLRDAGGGRCAGGAPARPV